MVKIRITQHASGRKTLQALGLKKRFRVLVVKGDANAIRDALSRLRQLVSSAGMPNTEASLNSPAGAVANESLSGLPESFEARSRSPEQLASMADYHRARRGFTTDSELAAVLGVHRTRLAAWKRGLETPTPDNARLLSHLAVTVSELGGFLDPDVIPDWLLTEQFTLGGRTPADALRDGRLAEVLYAANATEHGAYV
jgi:transcriptional regulator with XRE-family HTH domain/ribosomal protein L30/L7E